MISSRIKREFLIFPLIEIQGILFKKSDGGVLKWINDGFCDDINNFDACNYDEGDCCGILKNEKFCVDCQCISKYLITYSYNHVKQ